MRNALIYIALLLLAAAFATPAAATSGWGCYLVNVPPSNALNMRSGPSASAAVVDAMSWSGHGIIALDPGVGPNSDLFEVHQKEMEVCVPATIRLGARWCPVTIYEGAGAPLSGWVKRRYLDYSECP